MTAKLVLRDKEYEVRAGMTLLDALKKSNIVPEAVIATRDGEMIIDDEILRDGDVIKLIAVISGGSQNANRKTRFAFIVLRQRRMKSKERNEEL